MPNPNQKPKLDLNQLDEFRWEVPIGSIPNMRVPGIIYTDSKLITGVMKDSAPQQVANVATLPGILKASLAMPDIHWGYGFPIGGVAAFSVNDGIVSPGGVGYDINCGVRVATTQLEHKDLSRVKLQQLVAAIFQHIPCGVGKGGEVKISQKELEQVSRKGAHWAVEHGFGTDEDLQHIEDNGMIPNASPEVISQRAFERGRDQLGTLGSGNHFIEVQVVDKVFDEIAAQAFGLHEGQITLMIHTGSRGFGYQVCDDFLVELDAAVKKYGFKLPDRQLAAAPIKSPEGQRYLGAMASAANYAFANRQILLHLARDVFKEQFGKLGSLNLIYDVAHNIAKFEKYNIEGKMIDVLVHRKGATRALPKGHELVPARYRHIGQPVLIPGDMGTHSYILVGDEKTLTESFGSTCHGAGRLMSREAAIRNSKDRNIKQELNDKGIEVKWVGRDTLREEMSDAYKDVNDVVNVVDGARLSRKVARMRPLGVVKG